MWIVPKTLSAFVPDMAESSLDFDELASILEQSAMWRSKPSLKRTWLQRLNKVKWMRLLSGRILKPSLHSSFLAKYTESLADIPASHSATPASGPEPTTLDTFGRILSNTSRQLDLFGVSSRMSVGTLHLDTLKFTEASEILVIKLNKCYYQRQSVAVAMREKGFIYWPTMRAMCGSKGICWGRVRSGKHRHNLEDYLAWRENYNEDKELNLSPKWCEWLMMVPLGWTDFDSWVTE